MDIDTTKETGMGQTSSPEEKGAAPNRMRIWIAVFVGIILVYHATKFLGQNPVIFTDEQVYSYDIRLRPMGGVEIQNYLYYFLYKIIDLFGGNFLDAARVLNAVVFMASAPFVHLVARMACGRRVALFVALVSLLSPLSLYTQFLMPEALYYTSFWIALWLFMSRRNEASPGFWLAAGGTVALLSMVKYHGVFLLAPVGFHILTATPYAGWKSYAREAVRRLAFVAAAFVLVKLGLGVILAGRGAFAFLGSHYGTLSQNTSALPTSAEFWGKVLHSLAGQIKAISLVLGVPALVAVFLAAGKMPGGDSESGKSARRLARAFLFVIVPLMLVTALFAAVVASRNGGILGMESDRIHFRYYNFIFPASVILVGHVVSLPRIRPLGFVRRWCFLVPCAFALYATLTAFSGHRLIFAPDCPELIMCSKHLSTVPFHCLSVLGMASLALWGLDIGLSARSYLFLFLPLYIFYSFAAMHYRVTVSATPLDNDMAIGYFVRDHIGDEIDSLAIVDNSTTNGSRMLFALDDARISHYHYPRLGYAPDPRDVVRGKKWLLVVGDVSVPASLAEFEVDFPGARLLRVAPVTRPPRTDTTPEAPPP